MSEIVPGDWLLNFINDGISVPWLSGNWQQFDDHTGGWFDTDLETEDPDKKAFAIVERLADCTPEQLDAVAELLYLAIKTTRTISNQQS